MTVNQATPNWIANVATPILTLVEENKLIGTKVRLKTTFEIPKLIRGQVVEIIDVDLIKAGNKVKSMKLTVGTKYIEGGVEKHMSKVIDLASVMTILTPEEASGQPVPVKVTETAPTNAESEVAATQTSEAKEDKKAEEKPLADESEGNQKPSEGTSDETKDKPELVATSTKITDAEVATFGDYLKARGYDLAVKNLAYLLKSVKNIVKTDNLEELATYVADYLKGKGVDQAKATTVVRKLRKEKASPFAS